MFETTIQPLISTHGYWAVFLIVMLESAGVPLPGETALILAAVYAGVTGDLDIVRVVVTAAIAAIVGDNIGFWAGRRFGLPLVRRWGHLVGLDDKRLALGEYLFARHGAKIVFFGRFIAFLRIFAALLAGVSRFEWWRFLLWNAAGGILWATIFGVGGYVFGDAITQVTGPLGLLAFIAVVLGIGGAWWLAKRHEKHFTEKMENEMTRGASQPGADGTDGE
jgi:membrane protein DedA with SNARE-associated domain